MNQVDQVDYADVDNAPPDPVIDPGDFVCFDPVYLKANGYYFRNGHWYNGYYWRTHGYPNHDGTIVEAHAPLREGYSLRPRAYLGFLVGKRTLIYWVSVA